MAGFDWGDVIGAALAIYQQRQGDKKPNFYEVPQTEDEKWVNDQKKALFNYSPTRDYMSSMGQQMIEQNSSMQTPSFISPFMKQSGQTFGAGLGVPKIDFSKLPQAPWAVNRPGATPTPTQTGGGTGLIGSGQGDAHQPFNRIDNGAFDGNTVWGGAGSHFGDNGVMGEIDRGMRGMRNDPNNRVHAGNATGDPNYNPGPLPPAANAPAPTGAYDPSTGKFGGGDTPAGAGGTLGKVGGFFSDFMQKNPNATWGALSAAAGATLGPLGAVGMRVLRYFYDRHTKGSQPTPATP
jgi:hypothetical protein